MNLHQDDNPGIRRRQARHQRHHTAAAPTSTANHTAISISATTGECCWCQFFRGGTKRRKRSGTKQWCHGTIHGSTAGRLSRPWRMRLGGVGRRFVTTRTYKRLTKMRGPLLAQLFKVLCQTREKTMCQAAAQLCQTHSPKACFATSSTSYQISNSTWRDSRPVNSGKFSGFPAALVHPHRHRSPAVARANNHTAESTNRPQPMAQKMLRRRRVYRLTCRHGYSAAPLVRLVAVAQHHVGADLERALAPPWWPASAPRRHRPGAPPQQPEPHQRRPGALASAPTSSSRARR